MNGTYCIYRIVCFATGKCYVGRTKNYPQRKRNHLSAIKSGRHEIWDLSQDAKKYGAAAFYIETLEYTSDKSRESFWISKFDSYLSGYNGSPTGEGGGGFPVKWNGRDYHSISQAALYEGWTINALRKYLNSGHACDADILRPVNK
jgi:hypothetical protein